MSKILISEAVQKPNAVPTVSLFTFSLGIQHLFAIMFCTIASTILKFFRGFILFVIAAHVYWHLIRVYKHPVNLYGRYVNKSVIYSHIIQITVIKICAPGEDRTHDLKIMRLTRCLLRHRGCSYTTSLRRYNFICTVRCLWWWLLMIVFMWRDAVQSGRNLKHFITACNLSLNPRRMTLVLHSEIFA